MNLQFLSLIAGIIREGSVWKGNLSQVSGIGKGRDKHASLCSILYGGFLYATGMNFIPEWDSFQSEVRVAFTWQIRRTQPKAFSRARSDTHAHSPNTTRYKHDLRFLIRSEVRFQFTWYQNEISNQSENFIRIENRDDFNPEWLVRERNFVSVSCKQIQRNIWKWYELVPEWKSFRYRANSP